MLLTTSCMDWRLLTISVWPCKLAKATTSWPSALGILSASVAPGHSKRSHISSSKPKRAAKCSTVGNSSAETLSHVSSALLIWNRWPGTLCATRFLANSSSSRLWSSGLIFIACSQLSGKNKSVDSLQKNKQKLDIPDTSDLMDCRPSGFFEGEWIIPPICSGIWDPGCPTIILRYSVPLWR